MARSATKTRGQIIAGGAGIAVVALGWHGRRLRAAQAVQRRVIHAAERELQAAAAERARAARARQLLQITDAALAALPLEELMAELLSRVCSGMPADAAALLLAETPSGTLVLRATRGFEPTAENATLLPGMGLAARVTAERRAVVLVEAEVSQVRLTALREMQSVAGAPLFIDGQVIGVLEVGRREPVGFDGEDLAMLQLAADRTALAVDHARVFERERHIARTLQRSLLPERLPEIPGVELETRFLPVGKGQEVGGDFYDVIPLSEDRWLLVLGDVCGKGAEAAALTAMVRYTLRAEAVHEPRPGQLLGLVNDAMLAQRSAALFCTLACIVLDVAGEHPMITVAGGGAPPPLIIRADGRVEPLRAAGGPLVGVWIDAEFAEQRDWLRPGDVLLAYTDGLLEAHAPERILTPERLAVFAKACLPKPLGVFLRALESAALGSSIEPVRDDIATLALAVEPGPSPAIPSWDRMPRRSSDPQRGTSRDEPQTGAFDEPPPKSNWKGCSSAQVIPG